MWLFVAVAFAGEPRIHPTTGEPHTFVSSGDLSFDHVSSPIYPPEAVNDPSLPPVVRCTARLWSHPDGTVETVELLECPPAFRPLTETALDLYVFHDPHAAAPEPLVTEVVVEFTRPVPEARPLETLIDPVSKKAVPVVDTPTVLTEKRPRSTSDTPVVCTAVLFVSPAGRVETVSVVKGCPWPKPVVRAAMRWTFAPIGTPPEPFAVIREFELDP